MATLIQKPDSYFVRTSNIDEGNVSHVALERITKGRTVSLNVYGQAIRSTSSSFIGIATSTAEPGGYVLAQATGLLSGILAEDVMPKSVYSSIVYSGGSGYPNGKIIYISNDDGLYYLDSSGLTSGYVELGKLSA
jgi:hypothetical protein